MDAYFARFPRNRLDVAAADWDTLLILDACRYDIFRERGDLPGSLDARFSRGSNTGEFIEANFADARQHDTVYVTANPLPRVEKWCDVDVDEVFHAVVDVWEDHWDGEANTVRPGPVADAIRRAHADYPDKRIVGHFIQPHQPFIGETSRDIEEAGMQGYAELVEQDVDRGRKVWDRLADGELSADRVWRAYGENLELVLPHVRALSGELTGKTVVTSDHGNLFGEFAWPFPVREYGHPRGVHTRKLIEVPWLELPFETRRAVTAEPPTEAETEAGSAADEERLDRLRHLGYR